MTTLRTQDVSLGYPGKPVTSEVSVAIPEGSFTVIVGPNACGKSTLLRGLARLLRPTDGTVLLDGQDIARQSTRAVARTIGLLPQTSTAPDGIIVADLVSHGRYPHQSLLRQWSAQDEVAVAEALRLTSTTELADRYVDELSGGQRQRVWIAMALAQQTPVLLLDEPTTYLDIAHQIEVLDLCSELNRAGRTLVAVLHDLNQACRYATHLVAMKDGRVVAEGEPSRVVDRVFVRTVFGLDSTILSDPYSRTPLVVPAPHGAASAAAPASLSRPWSPR